MVSPSGPVCGYQSPLGWLEIRSEGDAIRSVRVVKHRPKCVGKPSPVMRRCLKQLKEYFDGKRSSFSFSMSPQGTPFQKMVWSQLLGVRYGQTLSYRDLAVRCGMPRAARAVGGAVGANPLCVLIPCHRVVASSGGLGGYAYGLTKKKKLLARESRRRRSAR